MTTEAKIFMWWVLFGGTHLFFASLAIRTALIRKIGLGPFKGLFSLVAFATFVPLCWVYLTDRHAGAFLFTPHDGLRHVTEAFMLLALFVLVQGQATANPLSTAAEMSGRHGPGPRGIQRVTRHPQNLAFALFGLGHCIANPTVGDWLFFGGFVVYAVASAIHQDRRTLAGGSDESRRYIAQTSLVPFAAILAGRQKLGLGEYRSGAAVVAAVVFALLRVFHGRLIGGFGA